jgi:hypothetical protein
MKVEKLFFITKKTSYPFYPVIFDHGEPHISKKKGSGGAVPPFGTREGGSAHNKAF